EVRVRYAPSPTGLPHIGNIRTALFNWLFARHHGGKFIVRIEDTDQERLVPGAVDGILDGLEWLDIDWDEGPRVGGDFGSYFQSERLHLYHAEAERLILQGDAYRCYCTRERLAAVRTEQERNKQALGYDGHCRHLSDGEKSSYESENAPSVVRFAMPDTGVTRLNDLIRDEVEWQNELVDDFILLKSDGFPTYHLAVVTDDHRMQISHVLRAEEWLSSAPRHLQLYRALGYTPPEHGHLPMILGPDRAKLSKRHGATSILEYRDDGFLPDALRNFMVLLGWSLDDKTEIMRAQTVVDNFTLNRVGKPAAIFDREKLSWMNGIYVREMAPQDLADAMIPFLEKGLAPDLLPVDDKYLLRIVPLIQERLKLLSDAPDMVAYFLEEQPVYDPSNLVQRGMSEGEAVKALDRSLLALADAEFSTSALEERLRALGEELELTPRRFFGTLRWAVTGRNVSPPLFETMEVLGRDRVLSRLAWAKAQLND
ncbi:Glutamate--tRNA ligase, partial [Geodia barretti]